MSEQEKKTEQPVTNEIEIKAKALEDELREAKEKAEKMAQQLALFSEEKKKEIVKILETAPAPIKEKYQVEKINPLEDYQKIKSEIEYHNKLVQEAEMAAKVKYEEIRQQIKKQYGTVLPDVAKIDTKNEPVKTNVTESVQKETIVELPEENRWRKLAEKPVLSNDEYMLVTRRLSNMTKFLAERRNIAISAQNER